MKNLSKSLLCQYSAIAVTIMSLTLPKTALAVFEKHGDVASACENIKDDQDPYCYFESIYREFIPLSARQIKYPSSFSKDLTGKKVALLFLDSKNFNQPVIVEGVAAEINSQRVEDYGGGSDVYYSYAISLSDGTRLSVDTDAIKEMRVSLSRNVSLNEFEHLYAGWQSINARYGVPSDNKNAEGRKAAFLVKTAFSTNRVVEGIIQSVNHRSSYCYDSSPDSYVMYTVQFTDGTVEQIDSDFVLSMRFKPIPLRILK